MVFKAVIFDYVGTLVNCKGYNMDASKEKLYRALVAEGFDADHDKFMQAYSMAHEKYRKVRYEQLKEVTNAVWVAEAFNSLGFKVTVDDSRLKSALNVFFQDFIDSLELRQGAKTLLRRAQVQCKIGLISNFTYAPVIYKSLRTLGICSFFNSVTVSEEHGWRKPSPLIFQDALKTLNVQAEEAVYIGDSPIEDIKGARQVGLKTVFISSQFNSLRDLLVSEQKPDFATSDLKCILEKLGEIVGAQPA